MTTTFSGQVAVITGASSGIGHALAKELARQGCQVGLIARRRDKLEQLAAEIRQAGGTVALAPADVGQRDEVGQAIAVLRQELGAIDVLIANAGVGLPTQLEPVNAVEVEAMLRINFLGLVYALEAVLPEMLQRGRGQIAGISSMAAYRGLPGSSAYCASKAAMNVYLEGLRIPLKERGIAVTTVCPGFVKTPMTADHPFHMPWLLEPDDAARRIVRALARRQKVCNFPWQMTLLMRCVARLPDWLLGRLMGRFGDGMGNRSG